MYWHLPGQFFGPIFYYLVFFLCLATYFSYNKSESCAELLKQHSVYPAFAFAFAISLFIGLRPEDKAFGDSYYYAWDYIRITKEDTKIDFTQEWIWQNIVWQFKHAGINLHLFFLFVASVYFLSHYYCCRLLLWENVWIAMLFFFSSFSFYTYSINGLRNGFACALLTLVIALIVKKRWLLAVILAFVSFGVHRSAILPIIAIFASRFIFKDLKYVIWIWLTSIVSSLFLGDFFTDLLSGLNFDKRVAGYAANTNLKQFSHTGFRWDFLLYSSVPVLFSYYVVIRRGIKEKIFNFIVSSYILANSVWILIIRIPFSNRFAYLSWFLLPLVFAYGFIRLPIWRDQDKKAGLALLVHSAFSLFMYLIGK